MRNNRLLLFLSAIFLFQAMCLPSGSGEVGFSDPVQARFGLATDVCVMSVTRLADGKEVYREEEAPVNDLYTFRFSGFDPGSYKFKFEFYVAVEGSERLIVAMLDEYVVQVSPGGGNRFEVDEELDVSMDDDEDGRTNLEEVKDGTDAKDAKDWSNRDPTAFATARPQSVLTGSEVELDGRNSVDPDGDELTYEWSVAEAPAGSASAPDPANESTAVLTPDKAGRYKIALKVSDGFNGSSESVAWVDAQKNPATNKAPAAAAGEDAKVNVGDVVRLDGSGSSDEDGDPLSFEWGITEKPLGSLAQVANALAANASFQADMGGRYVVSLVVSDGVVRSAADYAEMYANSAPEADAGADRKVVKGTDVVLDGSGTADVDEGDRESLTYLWEFVEKPAGSEAEMIDGDQVTARFIADVEDPFRVRLTAGDGMASGTDEVVISTNHRPVAEAGEHDPVEEGDILLLSGRMSMDSDGDALEYRWSFTEKPEGSAADFLDPTVVNPVFQADAVGDFTAELVVNDGLEDSDPDTVTVTVTPAGSNDTEPPVVEILKPAEGSRLHGVFETLADAKDNQSRVSTVEFFLGDVNIGIAFNEPYSVWSNTAGLEDGEYSLRVKATDSSPNMNESEESVAVVVDNTAPSFSRIAASPDPAKAGDAIMMTFQASEELSANPVVKVDGEAAAFSSVDGLSYTYSFEVKEEAGAGAKVISVEGRDMASNPNVGRSDGSVVFDFEAPQFGGFVFSKTIAKQGDELEVSFSVDEPLGENPVVTVSGNAAQFVALGQGNLYTYRYHVTGDEDEGVALVSVNGLDVAGNTGAAESQMSFDFTKPGLSGLEVSPSTIEAGYTLSVSFVPDEPLDCAATAVTVGGSPAVFGRIEQVGDANVYVYEYIVSGKEQEGLNEVGVVAADLAGNLSDEVVGEVTFDFTTPPPKPVAEFVKLRQNPPGDEDLVEGLAGAVEPSTLARLCADVSCAAVIAERDAGEDGSFPLTNLGDNLYAEVYVFSEDVTGNLSAPLLLRNDIAAPVFDSVSINPTPAKISAAVVIRFTSGETLATRPEVWVGDAEARFRSQSGLRYTYDYNVTGDEGDGEKDVRILSSDVYGNSGTQVEKITFDFRAPSTPVSEKVLVNQNFPGAEDAVAGAAGAVEANAKVNIYSDSLKETKVGSGAAAQDGSFGPVRFGDNLFAGIFVAAADSAGNESGTIQLSNDIEPPKLGNDPAGGGGLQVGPSLLKAGGTVSIVIEVNEPLCEDPEVSVQSHAASLVSQSGNRYSYSYTVSPDDQNGTAPVVARVRDRFGNESLFETIVTFDLVGPQLSGLTFSGYYLNCGKDMSQQSGNVPLIEFSISEEVKSPITIRIGQMGYDYQVSEGSGSQPDMGCWKTGLDYTCALLLEEGIGPDGVTTLTVDVEDYAGNADSESGQFFLDCTAPAAPVASKINVAMNYPGTADAVLGAAGAVEAGAVVIAYTSGYFGQGTEIGREAAAADGSFPAISVGDNLYGSFYLFTADAAGNVSNSLAVSNDVKGCTFNPRNPNPAKAGSILEIEFTSCEQLSGNPSVKVSGFPASFASKQGDTYSYTYTVTGSEPEGENGIAISGLDLAGNPVTGDSQVHLDFTAPGFTEISVTPGVVRHDTGIMVHAISTEYLSTDEGKTPKVKIAGVEYSCGVTQYAQGYSGVDCTLALAQSEEEGEKTVEIDAYDLTGNPGTGLTSIVFDFTPPAKPSAALVTVQQNAPGSADMVTGAAGAVDGSTSLVEVFADFSMTQTINYMVPAAGGSFGPLGIGDNLYGAVFVAARDEAGNRSQPLMLTNDAAGPVFGSLDVDPPAAKAGDNVSITFSSSEILAGNPLVLVKANPAEYVAKNGYFYTYKYVPAGIEGDGAALVTIAGTDLYGNNGASQKEMTFDFTGPALVEARFDDADFSGTVTAPDKVMLIFDENICVKPELAPSHFSLPVSGDAFGAGASSAKDASTDAVVRVSIGTAPIFTVPGLFSTGALNPGDPSGLGISGGIPSGTISDSIGNSVRLLPAVDMKGMPKFSDQYWSPPPDASVSAFADFNGDGKTDFAGYSQERLQIWFNDGRGGFTDSLLAFEHSVITGIAAGDIDSDGDNDLVFGDNEHVKLSIMRNDGGGRSWTETQTFAALSVMDMVIADMSGDGKNDLITADTLNKSYLYENDGAGGFSMRQQLYDAALPVTALALAAGDIDGDGDRDLLVSSDFERKIDVWRNDGTGALAYEGNQNFPIGEYRDLALVDLDGNGALDLVTAATNTAQTVISWLNDGAGNFSWIVQQEPLLSPAHEVCITDLDGDSRKDIVARSTSGLTALMNTGSLQFDPHWQYSDGSVSGLRCLDMEGDGDSDLYFVLSGSWEYLMENDGAGNFGFYSRRFGDGVDNMAIADFDGDNRNDAAMVSGTGGITFYKNRGDGYLVKRPEQVLIADQTIIAAADVDGDGDTDIATGSRLVGGAVKIFLNDGAWMFRDSGQSLAAAGCVYGSKTIFFEDFDGDGDKDLLTGTESCYIAIWLNNGIGTFISTGQTDLNLSGAFFLKAADIDGDGDRDLVHSNYTTTSFWTNDGSGRFSLRNYFYDMQIWHLPLGLAIGDFDGDGDQDIVGPRNAMGERLALFKNDGTGAFSYSGSEIVPVVTDGGSDALKAADLDLDGALDLAAIIDDKISFFLNDGNGRFSWTGQRIPVGNAYNLLAADMNGDGYPEVVDYNSTAVYVMMNRLIH